MRSESRFKRFLNQGSWPRAIALLGLVVFLPTACGRFLNEDKREEQVIEVSGKQFSCLREWPKEIRKFAQGESEEASLRGAFQCLSRALAFFQKHTKGSLPEAYTGDDLRKFFGEHFITETHIPSELAESFLRLKQVFFGGSGQFVTKAELLRVQSLLVPLESETVALAPFMKVLTFQKKGEVTEERIEKAISQLKLSLRVLLDQVDLSRSDYGFDEMRTFFGRIAVFAKDAAAPASGFDLITEWLPALQAVKSVFFGARADLRGIREWREAVNALADLYALGLRFHFLMDEGIFSSQRSLRIALQSGDKLLRILESSKQVRQGQGIPFSDLDVLIDWVLEKNLVRQPLSAGTIKKLYRKIVVRVLDPVRRGEDRGLSSLQAVHLASLRREFNVFRLNQAFLDQLGTGSVSHSRLRERIKAVDLNALIRDLTSDPFEVEALKKSWGRFRPLLDRDRPVVFDEQGRLLVSQDTSRLSWPWKARFRFNLMNFLMRGFLMGYGDASDPTDSLCHEAGMVAWYEDFLDFGRDLKAFDPRSVNSGARSFKEANFFTYSGNGDDLVEDRELFEFISTLFSAGVVNSAQFQGHLLDVPSCAAGGRDQFHFPLLKRSCVSSELRRSFAAHFGNLPDLGKSIAAFDDGEWTGFFDSLLAAAKSQHNPPDVLDTSDLRTAVTILHYAEILFVTYDANKDNLLNRQELLAAEPRFHDFLQKLKPKQNATLIREGFINLVETGNEPGLGSMGGHAWKEAKGFFSGRDRTAVRRVNILRVLGNLKSALEGELQGQDEKK